MTHASTGKPALSARAILLIELALAMGGFAIGTGEFAIMGLMPNVAQGLGISEPQVGHVISTYALGVVVGAPLLAIIGSRMFRRHLLLLLMSFFALGNFASALAPDYHTLMLFRFIAGLPHGAYFGVAMLVAASMVAPDQRAKAVSRVLAGLTIAMLIGNPTATWLGQGLSWRWAFALVGLIALLTVLLVAIFLPLDRSEPRNNPMRELRDFNRKPVWLALAISSIGFAGMFCVFSYLAPTLLEVTGVGENWIPVGLAAFGLGGIVGNIVGGWLFDKLGFKAVAWLFAVEHSGPAGIPIRREFAVDDPSGSVCGWHHGVARPAPADPPDGRRRGRPNARCRLQPFGVQRRQCPRPLARRAGDQRGPGLDFHRLHRCSDRRRRPAGVLVGMEYARRGGKKIA